MSTNDRDFRAAGRAIDELRRDYARLLGVSEEEAARVFPSEAGPGDEASTRIALGVGICPRKLPLVSFAPIRRSTVAAQPMERSLGQALRRKARRMIGETP